MDEAARAAIAEGAPSATALRVAVLRALHQSLDAPPVFADALAERILGPDAGPLLAAHRATARETAALRATLAARGVFAEGAVSEAVGRGIRQCVILGAGLDTFGYRHRHAGLRVIEVDRPAAQDWKRAALRSAGIEPPATLAYSKLDLGRGRMLGTLRRGGFDVARPAIFIMLGVSFYLPVAALFGLLDEIGEGCVAGSEIVFDYSEPLHHAAAAVRPRYEKAAARVAAAGEPWLTFFEPADLAAALSARGFGERLDLDATAQNARWFSDRPSALNVVPLAHLVRARTNASGTEDERRPETARPPREQRSGQRT